MSDLRLLIDARTLRAGRSGVGYYTEGMLHVLNSETFASDHVSAVVLGNQQGALVEFQRVRPLSVTADYESHPGGDFFEHVKLPRLSEHENANCLWGPAFQIPWRKTKAKRMVTIHDLLVFSHPHYYPKRFVWYMRQVIRRSVTAADIILCVSDTVSKAVLELFPHAAAKARVAYTAVVPFPSPTRAEALPEIRRPYILALGSLRDQRKNLRFLKDAFELARKQFNLSHQLVIAGQPVRSVTGEHVVLLPHQQREMLASLYANADLFVMPSLYEGFGLPIAEAMQFGCAIACSSAGALPEIGGDAVVCFDPTDKEQAVHSIGETLKSAERLRELRNASSQRAGLFSVESASRRLRILFDELLA